MARLSIGLLVQAILVPETSFLALPAFACVLAAACFRAAIAAASVSKAATRTFIFGLVCVQFVRFCAMTRDGRVYPVREILACDPVNDLAIFQLALPEGDASTDLAAQL